VEINGRFGTKGLPRGGLFLKKASCALALWPAEKLDQSEEPEGSGFCG
jgi:hypothetical protein